MPKTLQVRDLPDETHRRLKLRAAAEGRSLSDLVRHELIEVARRPTWDEIFARIDELGPADPGESSADAVRSGRGER